MHLLFLLFTGVNQRDHGTGRDAGDGYFIGIAGENLNLLGVVVAVVRQIDNRFAVARENGLGGDADRLGDAIDYDVEAAVHSRSEARIGVGQSGVGVKIARGRELEALFGEQRDLIDFGGQWKLGERIDMYMRGLTDGDTGAVDV